MSVVKIFKPLGLFLPEADFNKAVRLAGSAVVFRVKYEPVFDQVTASISIRKKIEALLQVTYAIRHPKTTFLASLGGIIYDDTGHSLGDEDELFSSYETIGSVDSGPLSFAESGYVEMLTPRLAKEPTKEVDGRLTVNLDKETAAALVERFVKRMRAWRTAAKEIANAHTSVIAGNNAGETINALRDQAISSAMESGALDVTMVTSDRAIAKARHKMEENEARVRSMFQQYASFEFSIPLSRIMAFKEGRDALSMVQEINTNEAGDVMRVLSSRVAKLHVDNIATLFDDVSAVR